MSKTLRVGILTPVTLMDPRTAFDFANSLVYWHLYQTPFRPSAAGDGSTDPVVFTGPLEPLGDDATGWTARVRPDLCFSDGTRLSPEILARSLRGSNVVREETEIEIDGDRLRFRLRRPHRRFDCLLCHPTSAIVHERGGAHYGSGPYVLDGSANGIIRLVPNPHFSPAPAIPVLEFTVYTPDADGRPRRLMAALEKGEVDFSLSLSRDDLHAVKGVHKWMGQGDSTAYLYFNTEHEWLSQAEVRRALAGSIDRRALAAASYASPLAFAASGPVPPSLAVMPDGVRPDPDAARAALDALGRPGRALNMLVVSMARPHLPHPATTADLLIEQFAAVGVEVRATPTHDVADYLRRVIAGDYDIALSGWIPDTPDLTALFEAIFGSKSVPECEENALVGANLSRWRNPSMDSALETYRQDPSSRNLNSISAILNDERPLLPLLYGSQVVVHSWRVKDRPGSYFNRPFFTEMRL